MTPGFQRRSVLAGLAGMGAAMTGFATNANAAGGKLFFQRHGLPIGLQLYTLGSDAAKDLDGTLAQVAKIGYRNIELAGLLGKTAPEMKAAMDRAGLTCTSAHIQGRAMGTPEGLREFPDLDGCGIRPRVRHGLGRGTGRRHLQPFLAGRAFVPPAGTGGPS